jgi:hypothetical protein
MPLTGTGGIGFPNDRRRAIGFWMTNKKARPIEPVRVFVTYEAFGSLIRRIRRMCQPQSAYSMRTAQKSKPQQAKNLTPEATMRAHMMDDRSLSCAPKTYRKPVYASPPPRRLPLCARPAPLRCLQARGVL